jgi:hypothetical protein
MDVVKQSTSARENAKCRGNKEEKQEKVLEHVEIEEEKVKTPCAESWSAWLCSWPKNNNPMFNVVYVMSNVVR